MRMSSNQKKFSLTESPEQPNSLKDRDASISKRSKVDRSLLLVNNSLENEAELPSDTSYVDPNSAAYQNIMLEDKINRHERVKQREARQRLRDQKSFGISVHRMQLS